MGAVVALAILLSIAPASPAAAGYLPIVSAASTMAAWIIGPSVVLTVISGLLSMAATPAFQNAGWVWAKAATGILVLQAGLHVIGPIQAEAQRAASAAESGGDPSGAARLLEAEINTLWVLLAVSVANVALGVWRPRFPKYPV